MPQAILLVEDDEVHGYALAKIIRSGGFDVTCVTTGAEALRFASDHNLDLVLLDVRLPDIRGPEIARQLRAQSKTSSVPIIFHSAFDTADGVQAVEECGANAFLTYPVEPDHLLQIIRGTLSRGAETKSKPAAR